MKLHGIFTLLAVAVVLTGCASPRERAQITAPRTDRSLDYTEAYQTVLTTKRFCDEAVGDSGATPKVVVAFRGLLKSPQADAAFKQLLVEATTAGKLYALCGIYYTDPPFFESAVQPFRHSVEEVETFMGCIIVSETVGSIVELFGPTTVRLSSRSQTIKQWATKTKSKGMRYDIIGGGWPNVFKQSGGY